MLSYAARPLHKQNAQADRSSESGRCFLPLHLPDPAHTLQPPVRNRICIFILRISEPLHALISSILLILLQNHKTLFRGIPKVPGFVTVHAVPEQ